MEEYTQMMEAVSRNKTLGRMIIILIEETSLSTIDIISKVHTFKIKYHKASENGQSNWIIVSFTQVFTFEKFQELYNDLLFLQFTKTIKSPYNSLVFHHDSDTLM